MMGDRRWPPFRPDRRRAGRGHSCGAHDEYWDARDRASAASAERGVVHTFASLSDLRESAQRAHQLVDGQSAPWPRDASEPATLLAPPLEFGLKVIGGDETLAEQQFPKAHRCLYQAPASVLTRAFALVQVAGVAGLTGGGSDNSAPARTHQPGSAAASSTPACAAASRSANSAKQVAPLPLIRER